MHIYKNKMVGVVPYTGTVLFAKLPTLEHKNDDNGIVEK